MAGKAFIIILLFLTITGIQAENIPFEKIENQNPGQHLAVVSGTNLTTNKRNR